MSLAMYGDHRSTLVSRLANARVSTAAANRVLGARGVGGLEFGFVPSYFVDGDGDGEDNCPVLTSTVGLRIDLDDESGSSPCPVPVLRDFPVPSELPISVASSPKQQDGEELDDATKKREERQKRLQRAREEDRRRGMHNPVHWFVPGGAAVPQELAEAQQAWRGVIAAAVDAARSRIELARIASTIEDGDEE